MRTALTYALLIYAGSACAICAMRIGIAAPPSWPDAVLAAAVFALGFMAGATAALCPGGKGGGGGD